MLLNAYTESHCIESWPSFTSIAFPVSIFRRKYFSTLYFTFVFIFSRGDSEIPPWSLIFFGMDIGKIWTVTLWIQNWFQETCQYFVVSFGFITLQLHFTAYHIGKQNGTRKKINSGPKCILELLTHSFR